MSHQICASDSDLPSKINTCFRPKLDDSLPSRILQVAKTLVGVELDDATIEKLLKRVPELPVIPTKNGYYIFVPTKCENTQNPQSSPSSVQHIPSSNNAPHHNETPKPGQVQTFHIQQMRGINKAGSEYSCVKGFGIFDGPSDDASIQAIKQWKAEIIRVPLNENCWLDSLNSAFSGENYRSAITDYVRRLRKNGLSVILDLHWTRGVYTGPGQVECTDKAAKCQKPMPDAESSPKFWESVANQFKDDNNIIFELFNNPYPDKAIPDKVAAWKCWKNGGDACPGFKYKVAGMQSLVNAVRKTGARNPIMLGGIRSANDLSKWQEYVPKDEKGKLIASWHSFKENECNSEYCWDNEIAPIAKHFPVIVAEIGEKDCSHSYIDKLMDWLDRKQISYLGWTWNTWDCASGPSLISDYGGTPTEFGKGLYNRLKGINNKPTQLSGDSKPAIGSNPEESNASGGSSTPKPSSSSNKSSRKQLRGVNRSGAEYACVKNFGIFEGPVDDTAVKTMKAWYINAVRIPLNEDCWLGINKHNPDYSGEKYKTAVIDYVNTLRKNYLQVILDLHWTDGKYDGPGRGECVDETAKCQKPMPDKQNATQFWKSVAEQFKNKDGIIFDLFNEPFPDIVIHDKTQAWKCWRDGGNEACPGFQYEVAGMQDLVNAVRKTGAKNQIMVGGIRWANDLSQWKKYMPKDEANNLAVSWHSYDFNACNNKDCWESEVASLAKEYPIIVGEIGQHGCAHNYIDQLLPWLDEKNISYVGWTWNTWDCSSGPSLISDYSGTPTNFGVGFKDHLSHNPISYGETSIEKKRVREMSKESITSENKAFKKQLRGVNRSGAEYSCVKNLGIFEGPVDDNAIQNMKKWNINVVRIPLNEDCWLGINEHTASYIGENYRQAVVNYVKLLRKNDLSVILDLHWSNGYYDGAGHGECIDEKAKCQKPMPHAKTSVDFWKSVAQQFNGDDNIIFDLYNEPFPDMIYWEKDKVWKCWREGGKSCPHFPFPAAGMQSLVNAVREVGATNPVMVAGINWASDLSQWKKYVPNDPLNKLVASWHAYALNPCNNTNCWETMIAPIAKEYPIVVGEMGETDCTHEYIDKLMDWLEKYKISYVGWTWNTWGCESGPALITDYNGTPTEFGRGLYNHLTKKNK